jgi:predicted ATPase/DNA-binding CsgD family transcriptional regulator
VGPSSHLSTAAQPTALIGRASELEAIIRRLCVEGVRLLTLTGPAGVGKTRLALAAVATDQVVRHFPDGVHVVELARVQDPAQVLPAIALTLGLADTGPPPLLERLRAVLSERAAVLLVLDNFEQVLPEAATELADLLASCAGLSLLVTSRMPLQLRWEQTLRVPPLPLPTQDGALPPLEVLAQVPSVALFVERARARREDFVLTEKQAPLVAQVAIQLDGLPLALELAAARLDVLSLSALVRRLGDRLRLLVLEAPDRPAQQQSLEASVGWSYDLLSEPERQLFRCLGVFVGWVTLDAIAVVVGTVRRMLRRREQGTAPEGTPPEGTPPEDTPPEDSDATVEAGWTLPRLLSLAEKSLVLPARPEESEGEEEEDPEPAFGMLETMREYAHERLAAAGELAAARWAHAHYFLALAERAASELQGSGQRAWLVRLEREHANLRAALSWLLDQEGSVGHEGIAGIDLEAEPHAALRLAAALSNFWWRRGYHAEGERRLEEALARVPHWERVDPGMQIRALMALGALLAVQGAFARARAVLEEGLALAAQRQDAEAVADALTYLGLCEVLAGEVVEGIRQLQEALPRWEAMGNSHGVGFTRFYLGLASDRTRDIGNAAAHYSAALQRLGAVGDAQQAGFVHCYLGVAEWKRGKLRSAVAHIQTGVQTGVSLQDRWLLSVAACAASVLAKPVKRARLLGASDTLRQATGALLVWEGMPGGQDVLGLRTRLASAEGEWDAAYREGRTLRFGEIAALAQRELEEALAQALPHPDHDGAPEHARAVDQPAVVTPSPHQGHCPQTALTERDQEVLRLVAEGLSSKAIGRQLFIAPSTVNYHLTSVFHKLGVDTRAQAVAVAAQCGLL